MQLAFMEADLLLPVSSIDPATFSVIACDQFTSQPDYWQEAARIAGDTPSALQLICPEIYLKDQNLPARIDAIWAHMEDYLKEGVFQEYPHSFFYVRRTLPNGKLRQGVVGMVDLEAYDFSQALILRSAPANKPSSTAFRRVRAFAATPRWNCRTFCCWRTIPSVS